MKAQPSGRAARPVEFPPEALPLLVGVVGHGIREGDVVVLEDRLRAFFTNLASRYPATPLCVVSLLQHESERLAVEAAVACGGRLIEAPASADGSAADCRAGFVVRNCHLLLALWDGQASSVPGDVSEVVRFRLEGLPEALEETASRLDDEGVGLVEQLVVPRGDGSPAPPDMFSWRRLAPAAWGNVQNAFAESEHSFHRQDEFNADASQWRDALESEREQSGRWLLPAEVVAAATSGFRAHFDRFTLADVLALRYQQQSLTTLRGVLGLGMIAALCLQLGKIEPDWTSVSTLLYLLALLGALGWFAWARRRGFESRYLDYRALAEGLRVAIFWRLAGRCESVADLYLRRQRGELDWIRAGLKAWDALDGAAQAGEDALPRAAPKERFALVQKHWLRDQRDYYVRRATHQGRINRRYSVSKKLCVGISFTQAFLRVAVTSDHFLFGTFGLTLLVAGLLHLYAKTRAFAEHSRQYERLGRLFDRATRVLDQSIAAGDEAASSAVIAEAGREALQENADWLLLHRERPVSVPGLT